MFFTPRKEIWRIVGLYPKNQFCVPAPVIRTVSPEMSLACKLAGSILFTMATNQWYKTITISMAVSFNKSTTDSSILKQECQSVKLQRYWWETVTMVIQHHSLTLLLHGDSEVTDNSFTGSLVYLVHKFLMKKWHLNFVRSDFYYTRHRMWDGHVVTKSGRWVSYRFSGSRTIDHTNIRANKHDE